MDVLLCKQFGSLRPIDDAGEEILRGIRHGDVIRASIKRPRNVKHHRLYWALISLLHQNQEIYATPELLSDAIKCAVGHYEVIYRANGVEYRKPKSISFASMDQDQFRAFWDRVCDLACTRIVPGLKRADLEREIMEMVSG